MKGGGGILQPRSSCKGLCLPAGLPALRRCLGSPTLAYPPAPPPHTTPANTPPTRVGGGGIQATLCQRFQHIVDERRHRLVGGGRDARVGGL